MWLTIILAAITCFILLFKSLFSWLYQMKQLPAGPLPIPLYGNRIPKEAHPGMCNWYAGLRTKFGDVYTVYHGTKPTVVVNGFKSVSELLITNGSLVHTRPSETGILSFLHDDAGLVWNNSSYKTIRKISSSTLKSFTNTYSSTESSSVDKLNDLLDSIEDKPATDISAALKDIVAENICAIIFGQNQHEKFPRAMQLHNGSLSVVGQIDSFLRAPFLKYIPGLKSKWLSCVSKKTAFHQFIQQVVDEHTAETVDEKACDDVLDGILRHNRAQKAAIIGREDCYATVMQLLLAGLDAVHGSLMWLFLYISINPSVQNKMAEEIESQLGYERTPTTKNMGELPYCMAVIYETIRVSNVAFTSLPYLNQQEVTINGKRIPANSSILVNLVSVNKDPQVFEEPDKFMPERFIDKDGKLINMPEFLPFSIGRRACIGETFSKSNIFITVVRVLQRYKLCTVADEKYSTAPVPSFLSFPAPYKLKYEQRCSS